MTRNIRQFLFGHSLDSNTRLNKDISVLIWFNVLIKQL